MDGQDKNFTTQFHNRLIKYVKHHHKDYWGGLGELEYAVKFLNANGDGDNFEEPPESYYYKNERAFGMERGILKTYLVFERGDFKFYIIFLNCCECPDHLKIKCEGCKVLFYDVWWTSGINS